VHGFPGWVQPFAAKHTLYWHDIEQQSLSALQCIQFAVHVGVAAHAPFSHDVEQHCAPSLQLTPSPRHGMQAPLTQRWEQHC
jgi:hypothetical protein